jgi:hypothetical protein
LQSGLLLLPALLVLDSGLLIHFAFF